ncbi:MAG: murein biosynthesis integral membrane protein MurJ [Planctomycetota bacterium]|nr:murein biosynthesis integral membrane protein MurJ [Planctomycetota bacterium]
MPKGFEHHARTFTLLTMASRVTGLARDAALTRVFGLGPVADAFTFAFMVPNLFRRLFGEGALSSAFLPAYAKHLESDGEREAGFLAWRVLSLAGIVMAAIVVIGELALGAIHLVDAREQTSLSLALLAIMLPYMPLVCLVALLGAVLQVHHRFGPTASAPVILNLTVAGAAVAGWLTLGESDGVSRAVIVALAVLVSGILQLAWCLLAVRPLKVVRRGTSERAHQVARGVWATTVPMALGLGVLQINTLVDGIIASWPTAVGPTILGFDYPLKEGSMSTLSFAQRLYEFPLGVFGVAIATAIFPQLAREASDPARFHATLRRGLRLSVFLGAAASTGLAAVCLPLATTLYVGAAFTMDDAWRVAWVVLGYAPAIWAYSVNQLYTRAFYAMGDTRTPVRLSIAMVALNFTLNVILIWTPLGVAGLAWSTGACAVLQCVILGHKLAHRTGRIVDRDVGLSLLRSAGIALGMGAIVAVIVSTFTIDSWSSAAVALLAGTTMGAGLVIAAAALLKAPELSWAMGRPAPSASEPSDNSPGGTTGASG